MGVHEDTPILVSHGRLKLVQPDGAIDSHPFPLHALNPDVKVSGMTFADLEEVEVHRRPHLLDRSSDRVEERPQSLYTHGGSAHSGPAARSVPERLSACLSDAFRCYGVVPLHSILCTQLSNVVEDSPGVVAR